MEDFTHPRLPNGLRSREQAMRQCYVPEDYSAPPYMSYQNPYWNERGYPSWNPARSRNFTQGPAMQFPAFVRNMSSPMYTGMHGYPPSYPGTQIPRERYCRSPIRAVPMARGHLPQMRRHLSFRNPAYFGARNIREPHTYSSSNQEHFIRTQYPMPHSATCIARNAANENMFSMEECKEDDLHEGPSTSNCGQSKMESPQKCAASPNLSPISVDYSPYRMCQPLSDSSSVSSRSCPNYGASAFCVGKHKRGSSTSSGVGESPTSVTCSPARSLSPSLLVKVNDIWNQDTGPSTDRPHSLPASLTDGLRTNFGNAYANVTSDWSPSILRVIEWTNSISTNQNKMKANKALSGPKSGGIKRKVKDAPRRKKYTVTEELIDMMRSINLSQSQRAMARDEASSDSDTESTPARCIPGIKHNLGLPCLEVSPALSLALSLRDQLELPAFPVRLPSAPCTDLVPYNSSNARIRQQSSLSSSIQPEDDDMDMRDDVDRNNNCR